MPEPTPKIFISYAWKNQPIAKCLQSDLKRDGVEVFVDYEKITGGDSLPERISAALDWCNTLVLLWSADSAESYYVKQEWSSAFHLQKKIIACVLDGTKLPAVLASRLYLNFAPYETGYTQLCRSLGVTPKMMAAKPAPPEPPQSKLPPQHAEMPVPQPPDEKRETPPPVTPKRKFIADAFRRKPKPPDPAPVLKPPEIFDDSKHDEANAAEMATPSRWSRRKIVSATFGALIIVAAIVLMGKMNCPGPTPPISEPVKKNDSSLTANKQRPPATSPQSAKPDSTAKKQVQPTNVPPLKPNKLQSRTGRTSSSPRFSNKPATLSYAQVKTMLRDNDFYCQDYDWNKEFSNPQGRGFANKFEESVDGLVVIARASNLMWQQSGSEEALTYEKANAYVAKLRRENYGRYSDWRLPTLEEAMSLMERDVPDGDLYINLLFDRTQRWIWTSDTHSAGVAWVAGFYYGYCYHYRVAYYTFVRVVR